MITVSIKELEVVAKTNVACGRGAVVKEGLGVPNMALDTLLK